ncbi:uncharacterized protein LOC135124404 [Zophobas morio]|uniref:uncharacterized protein LOC135124404 n=1 Tax=Zophobas morio TaxID=2755281 RepID=UPI003082865D
MGANPIKVIFLGPSGAGKTSIIKRYIENSWKDNGNMTMGCDLYTCKHVISDIFDLTLKFHLWDTAGQERFCSIIPRYYREAKVALLVFDITSQKSFEKMKRWFAELENNASPMVLCLIGNKTDLDKKREVTKNQAKHYAESISASYYECSAQQGEGIREVFDDVARRMISLLENITGSSEVRSAANTKNTISLTSRKVGPSVENNTVTISGGTIKSRCYC